MTPQEAFDMVYGESVPDPDTLGDEWGEVSTKTRERFEEALAIVKTAWDARTADAEALDRMNRILSAPTWSVGMLEDLCEILRNTGRETIPSDYLHH